MDPKKKLVFLLYIYLVKKKKKKKKQACVWLLGGDKRVPWSYGQADQQCSSQIQLILHNLSKRTHHWNEAIVTQSRHRKQVKDRS